MCRVWLLQPVIETQNQIRLFTDFNRVWPEIGSGMVWDHEYAGASPVTLTLASVQNRDTSTKGAALFAYLGP